MTMEEKRKPWLKWYPSDWRAEPRLRLVSRAARSVWLDMLGLMHESTLIGYLLVNGKKPTPEQLARILGDDIRDLSQWLDELNSAGVYSETDDGIVFSRRMVRDHERAEKGRKDVEKRWGPKRKSKGEGDSTPNRVPTQQNADEPTTQRPEARGQKDLNPTRGFKSSGVARDAAVKKPAASPAPQAAYAGLLEHEPDWADNDPRWAEFKRSMPLSEWSAWFKGCHPGTGPNEIITPGMFDAQELDKRYGPRLARELGAPVKFVAGKQQPRQEARPQ